MFRISSYRSDKVFEHLPKMQRIEANPLQQTELKNRDEGEILLAETEQDEKEKIPVIKKWIAHTDYELSSFIETDKMILIPDSIISQEWRDIEMDYIEGLEYDHCTIKDFLTIGHRWLTSLYKDQLEEVAPVTVWLALHLMNPDDKNGLIFKTEWQKPHGLSRQLKNVTTPQTIEKLEKFSNIEISKVQPEPSDVSMFRNRRGVFECPEQETYFSDYSFTADHQQMLTTIKSLPNSTRANLYSYLAAIICRVITENPSTVCDVFTGTAMSCFASFYNTGKLPFKLLSPKLSTIEYISHVIKPCTPLTISLLKGFLTKRKVLKPSAGQNMMTKSKTALEMLDEILLHPISMHGLELVQFAIAAMNELGLPGFGQLFRNLYGRMQAKSFKHLSKFSDLYFHPDSVEVLFPWATLFSSSYFADLAIEDNSLAAGLFIAIVDPDEPEPAWSSKGLNLKSDEKRFILSVTQRYREMLRQDCITNPF